MNLIPKTNWLVGRIVDFEQSKGGITLPTGDFKVTVLLLVDRIGPDVKNAKEGDLIVFLSVQHVWMRDGTKFGVVIDDGKNVIATVEDADLKRLILVGEKKSLAEAQA